VQVDITYGLSYIVNFTSTTFSVSTFHKMVALGLSVCERWADEDDDARLGAGHATQVHQAEVAGQHAPHRALT